MTRRGLTLTEMLVAVALLATMVAATTPLLRAARQQLENAPPPVPIEELSRIADTVLATPERFGLSHPELRTADTTTAVPANGTIDRITISRRTTDAGQIWLVFSTDEDKPTQVARWIGVAPDDPAEAPER